MTATLAGRLIAIDGAVVRAELEVALAMGEVVRVGEERLLGEVIALDGRVAVAQVYEDTEGLAPGAPIFGTGAPLEIELGPGLVGAAFDGVQRPLEALARGEGDFLGRGRVAPSLDRDRLWPFTPALAAGATVAGGEILGTVPETPSLEHRVLVPPDVRGTLAWIAPAGTLRVTDPCARVDLDGGGTRELTLLQRWRARAPRPFRERLPPAVPLVTGQRVLDTFFPLARGAAVGIPGGFGTGKTILQQQLCKWADADVIVFVGCGERGNEMTRMLRELPELVDPRTGRPLADRTVLIANTSNMPVSAREASLYTGVTIAEYYRDMGHHVALLADSTSRWAEALREISGRLGEMPAEEGYPPYLSSRLAAYYERAGRVTTLSGREGSTTLLSAISPAGGDLTEPVTRHTQSFTRVFWCLDRELASARVFPAVSVAESYSDLPVELEEWWENEVAEDWTALRRRALTLLEEAGRLEATARLIGAESLPDRQRFCLRVAELVREGFLQQNAFDPRDATCPPARQAALLRVLLRYFARGLDAIDAGAPAERVAALPVAEVLLRARTASDDETLGSLVTRVDQECGELAGEVAR